MLPNPVHDATSLFEPQDFIKRSVDRGCERLGAEDLARFVDLGSVYDQRGLVQFRYLPLPLEISCFNGAPAGILGAQLTRSGEQSAALIDTVKKEGKPTVRQVYALAAALCERMGEEFPESRGDASGLIERLRTENGHPAPQLEDSPRLAR